MGSVLTVGEKNVMQILYNLLGWPFASCRRNVLRQLVRHNRHILEPAISIVIIPESGIKVENRIVKL